MSPTDASTNKLREKKKWQIALRRYLFEGHPSTTYAPYFGLDRDHLSRWFKTQLPPEIGWSDFASKWQFGQVVPVDYFNLNDPDELFMCWNFTNLKVDLLGTSNAGTRLDLVGARLYFEKLYALANYTPCINLIEKIRRIEAEQLESTVKQQQFISENQEYLESIKYYASLEFELLNQGHSPEMIEKEAEMIKRLGK